MADKKRGPKGSNKKGDNNSLAPHQEDEALWRDAMKDVAPLPEKTASPETQDPIHEIRRIRKKLREKGAAPPSAHGVGGQGAKAADLDRRSDDRLRRGLMEIEARLDMHGMTQDSALGALERFIFNSRQRGLRCVLVITGKGSRRMPDKDNALWYEPQPGILRERVVEWLRAGAIAESVLRFYPAKQQHGGDGAFYVLLRRNREG